MGQSDSRVEPGGGQTVNVAPRPGGPAQRSGFTNQEAKDYCEKIKEEGRTLTPQDVLADLQRGNSRFYMQTATRPEGTAFNRTAFLNSQHPRVAVLGCSDSRVPIEMVFDKGLGEVFTIRVAGNYLDTSTYGTVEYACAHLKVKVLIVMGHESCGAIGAACLPVDKIDEQPASLRGLLMDIKGGLDETKWVHLHGAAKSREAVVNNVAVQVAKLKQNEIIAPMLADGSMILKGAFYSMTSGIVDFLPDN